LKPLRSWSKSVSIRGFEIRTKQQRFVEFGGRRDSRRFSIQETSATIRGGNNLI